ncbi:hypothetical protein NNO93_18440, partial [Acinetobacter baumannii]|nr:hypothetical protein [Acinetobacter baumannii]
IEDIRESKPYFFPKPNGAGGQGGNNSGGKNTIKRSEFDAMSPLKNFSVSKSLLLMKNTL